MSVSFGSTPLSMNSSLGSRNEKRKADQMEETPSLEKQNKKYKSEKRVHIAVNNSREQTRLLTALTNSAGAVRESLIDILEQVGSSFSLPINSEKQIALHHAVIHSDDELFDPLVHRSNIVKKDINNMSPLDCAVQRKQIKYIKEMVGYLSRQNIQQMNKDHNDLLENEQENTNCCFTWSVENQQLGVLEVLLAKGYNPDLSIWNEKSHSFSSPTVRSIAKGEYEVAKLLLRYRAGINIEDESGFFPLAFLLTYSCSSKSKTFEEDFAFLKSLIDKGAKINQLCFRFSYKGFTPLDLFFLHSHDHLDERVKRVIDFLVSKGGCFSQAFLQHEGYLGRVSKFFEGMVIPTL